VNCEGIIDPVTSGVADDELKADDIVLTNMGGSYKYCSWSCSEKTIEKFSNFGPKRMPHWVRDSSSKAKYGIVMTNI
jgi:hypothetical protein